MPVFSTPATAPYLGNLGDAATNGNENLAGRLQGLAELADPKSDDQNPDALFHDRYLRRGNSLMLVAPSGVGKSSFTIQASIRWAAGEEAFGIRPVRPLRICIIQAEDDDDEVAEFRNDILAGLCENGTGIEKYAVATASVKLFSCKGLAGDAFFEKGLKPLLEKENFDLVVINPLFAFLGGNVSDQETVSHWLREGLDPVISGKCAALVVHHTNKISAPADSKRKPDFIEFAEYLGAGSAELVNYFRAILALMPITGVPGHFRLIAAKRGKRLGWPKIEGEARPTKYFRHDDRLIFWREVAPDKLPSPKTKKDDSYGDAEEDAQALAADIIADGKPVAFTPLRDAAQKRFGRARGNRAYDCLVDNPQTYGLEIRAGLDKTRSALKLIGTTKALDDLAGKEDSCVQS